MSRNVWERCSDWYADDYYAESLGRNPQGPESGSSRGIRGGSWNAFPSDCPLCKRKPNYPDGGPFDFGFRLALLR